MRTSADVYKLKSGGLVGIASGTYVPEGLILWTGYDYKNQYWVFEGKKDTRTLEELRQGIKERSQ